MTKIINLLEKRILKMAELNSQKILEGCLNPSEFHSSLNIFRVRRMLENW